jgi:hypothetical protein
VFVINHEKGERLNVHLGPRVGFGGLMTSFVAYNIQKCNMDVEINFYMGINDEKGKSHKHYIELRVLYFI